MLGLVREQLDQAHRDGMLAGMPPEMRTMWTEHMRGSFEAAERVLKGEFTVARRMRLESAGRALKVAARSTVAEARRRFELAARTLRAVTAS